MHECWSNAYSTSRKAFLERLCHLCCKGGTPGEPCLHYDVLLRLSNHAMMSQTGVQLRGDGGTHCVHGCRSAAWDASLVGLGEAQGGGGHGRQQEDGAGQEDAAPGAVHLAAVQRLHRPEGVHHRLPVGELELGEFLQLRAQDINTDVRL